MDVHDSRGPGQVRDQTFQEFADYMVRVLRYYNKGSMTSETGEVIDEPGRHVQQDHLLGALERARPVERDPVQCRIASLLTPQST